MQLHPTVRIEEMSPGVVRPSHYIIKAGVLIDLIFNHPASCGTLGLSMLNILCPMFKEGQEARSWKIGDRSNLCKF